MSKALLKIGYITLLLPLPDASRVLQLLSTAKCVRRDYARSLLGEALVEEKDPFELTLEACPKGIKLYSREAEDDDGPEEGDAPRPKKKPATKGLLGLPSSERTLNLGMGGERQ